MSAPGQPVCRATITDGTELLMKKIGVIIRDNALAVCVCTVILCSTLLVAGYMGKMMYDSVTTYHRQMGSRKAVKAPTSRLPNDPMAEDITYASEVAGSLDSMPADAEATVVKGAMGQMQAKYDAYNRAIRDYLTARGRPVDDVMDRKVLDRSEDDYKYGTLAKSAS